MRVLFVNPAPDRTEAAMAAGLVERSIPVTVLPRHRGNIGLLKNLDHVRYLPIDFPWDLSAVRRLRRLLKEDRCDVVHVFNGRACLPTLLAVRGLRRVKVFWYRGAIMRVSRIDPWDRVRYFDGGIDCFIASCDAARKSLVQAGVDPAKAVTIYKGHDPGWYEEEPVDLRKRFGIAPEAFVAGAVAKARKAKGLQHLIRSASILGRLPGRYAIIVVGRDSERILAREVKRLRRGPAGRQCPVYLAGEMKEGSRAMRSFDCFVMPSLDGAFGIDKAVIEAMSQRLPVIATRAAGLPEVVEHERNGFLIPPGSPQAIADMIRRLASEPDLKHTLGQAARRTITERFNVENMVERTVCTYQRFLDRL